MLKKWICKKYPIMKKFLLKIKSAGYVEMMEIPFNVSKICALRMYI
jgi:hypothetical protein